jgi:stearoyl-CoA desaturase (delta-9 desaturase)
MTEEGRADTECYARDPHEDAGMRFISRSFVWLVAASLAIPALVGFAITGTAFGALTGFLWGGLVRIFLVHHVTWSINSVLPLPGHAALRRR